MQAAGVSPPPSRQAHSVTVLLWVVIGAGVRRTGVATAAVIVVGAPLISVMAGIGDATRQRARQRDDTEGCSQKLHAVLHFGWRMESNSASRGWLQVEGEAVN